MQEDQLLEVLYEVENKVVMAKQALKAERAEFASKYMDEAHEKLINSFNIRNRQLDSFSAVSGSQRRTKAANAEEYWERVGDDIDMSSESVGMPR